MKVKPTTRILSALLFLAFSTLPAQSAVLAWRAEKGADFLQTSDNTQPSGATNWFAASFVETDLPCPQNSYTDTLHTAEDDGFYSIDVQLEN